MNLRFSGVEFLIEKRIIKLPKQLKNSKEKSI